MKHNVTDQANHGVVTVSDHRYFPGVKALVNSIRKNSPLPVALIDEGLTPHQRQQLIDLDVQILQVHRTIALDTRRFGCCLALFDIDQAPFDSILYLDADTLVLDDLSHLFPLIKQFAVVATVENPTGCFLRKSHRPRVRRILRRVGRREFIRDLRPDFGGFLNRFKKARMLVLNSGLLGIKKELLKTLKTSVPKYLKYISRFQFPDQNLLSLLLAEQGIRFHELDWTYNVCRLHCHPTESPRPRRFHAAYCRNVEVRFENGLLYLVRNKNRWGVRFHDRRVKVLHFNTIDKPWRDIPLRKGFKDLWEHYYNLPI
jgi:lipopolysaccharide biosynthesis glycosyltransferase